MVISIHWKLIKIPHLANKKYTNQFRIYSQIVDIRNSFVNKHVGQHTKSSPNEQHIWFLPTRKLMLKKPKELFFANARQNGLQVPRFWDKEIE